MNYKELFKEENDGVAERHQLVMERILCIKDEDTVAEPYSTFFKKIAGFIELTEEVYRKQEEGILAGYSLSQLEELNNRLYEDILPNHYEESYANPAYAVKQLGQEYGALLSFLYTEIRGMIVYAYESRLTDMTILEELFIEVYNLFEGEEPELKELNEVLYYFVSDYCDVTLTYRIREMVDPSLDFATNIIMNSDLSDLRYLYRFGEYIGSTELLVAKHMNSLSEETVEKMADTFTEGYLRGFAAMGRDYSKKKTVQIRCQLGFERMIRKAVVNFRRAGLEPVFCRAAVNTVNRGASRNNGYYGAPANKQYEYDHRYDNAIYMDKAFKERKLAVLKVAFDQYREPAADYAGPAVLQTFGEERFKPENKKEAFSLQDKQEKLVLACANEAMQLQDAYIPNAETSFTIIAFPVPDIGPDFNEIFNETIRINTLDNEQWKKLQQKIVDELDKADHVVIKGSGTNKTCMTVMLKELSDPTKETKFENCVADVNIPVGEVFTSPKLVGTHGTLFVGSVYIGGIQFENLCMTFADGRITSYTCSNFEDEKECRELVKQTIMKNHDSLPLGEFAIGTNTTAYAVAIKYGILDKLPILVAEKMGPHFAVGDTCYSWSEDCAIYNPDGKEIVAKDNEISALRTEEPSKAYFSCHTDITIPYSELDSVEAVRADGSTVSIISGGRFVLPGTESLNLPLEGLGELE